MFLPDPDGFAAYDAVTGERLWRSNIPTADWETPKFAVSGNLLLSAINTCGSVSDPDGERFIVGDTTGRLSALRAGDGVTLWSTGGIARDDGSAPVAVGDTRIYAVLDTHLIALDAADGTKVWDASSSAPRSGDRPWPAAWCTRRSRTAG